MQESGCQPDEVGEGGEQGMMQISEDKVSRFRAYNLSLQTDDPKCNGAPNGNCRDPDFNVHQGTQFLSETLTKNNGNVLGGEHFLDIDPARFPR
jgi:hypothetical protein